MTTCKKGDRIRLLSMPDDPDPIAVGSTGTVTYVTTGPLAQVGVAWDNGRSLNLIPGTDAFEVIEDAAPAEGSVPIPRAVLDGIAAARDSGMFNMLDMPAIAGLTRQLGFDTAADWLCDPSNRKAYAEGIFRGFRTAE